MTVPTVPTTREAWLLGAVAALAPLFEEVGETVPSLRVSVGFPGGRGPKATVIGQCWATEAAEDETAQIFISPVLSNPVEILATLAHEMIHAIDDCKSGHRGRFLKIAKAVGFEAPMTSTPAGPDLKARLVEIAADLDPFPHAALSPAEPTKKQGPRMFKVECPADGYIVRTTAKWLALGLPVCPCGTEMEAPA